MNPTIQSKLPKDVWALLFFHSCDTLAVRERNAINYGAGLSSFDMNQALPQLVTAMADNTTNMYIWMDYC
jgi:hypothetical protein